MKKTTINPIIHLSLNVLADIKLVQSDTAYIVIENDDQDLVKVKDHKGHIHISMKPTHHAQWGKTQDGMRSIHNRGIYAEGSVINNVVNGNNSTITIGSIIHGNGNTVHITRHGRTTLKSSSAELTTFLEKLPTITVYSPTFPAVSLSGSSTLVLERLNQESLDFELMGSGSVIMNIEKLDQLSFALSGSGNMDISGIVDKIDARTSGSSDLSFNVTSHTLKIRSSGSSDIFLKGKTERLSAHVSGSGDIDGRTFETNYADLKATGSSDIVLKNPLEDCIHTCSGSGDIEFC